ncbi:MAG: hypothetical protein M3348_15285 [Acidobacteriota bacterium]|nr:hypothetical protein [Acidobacteriota bacterium]
MTSTPSANAQAGSGPAALAADGPAADRDGEMMLFGQFVGDWDVDFTVYGPDGTRQTEKAEWHFGWVLEGRAVQDVWIVPRRGERDKASPVPRDYGTTIRFYDPAIDAWRVVYASPVHGDLLTFVARRVGDEIVLEGRDPEGSPMRWIFSEITGKSFRWRRVVSTDGGKTWQLHKEMSVRRAEQPQEL